MTTIPTMTLLLGVGGVLLITRFRQGPMLSPISLTLLMLTAIFGVRPLLMVQSQNFEFYGGQSEQGFHIAANVGLIAVTSLLVGYLLGLSRQSNGRSALRNSTNAIAHASESRPVRFRLALVLGIAFVLFWFGIMAYVGGGTAFISLLFAGRSDEVSTRLENVPSIVPALPVVAALIAANARIVSEKLRPLGRGERLLYWIVILVAVIPPAALGTRRFLIPSLVAGAVGVAAAHWKRRISLRMLLLVVGGFIVLAILPFVRSAGSRTSSSDLIGAIADFFSSEGLAGVLNGFFLSYDTEMYNYIAYVAPSLGSSIPYGLGRLTVLDVLISPIPASISPFTTWSNVILTRLYGGGCAEVFCPVPSLPGALYFDAGFVGVAVVMAAVGWTMSRFESNFLSADGPKLTALLAISAFTIQIVRGNPASQIWIAFQVFVFVAVAMRLSSGRRTALTKQPQKVTASS